MFEQNRCMGKKVSIFNGVGFGTNKHVVASDTLLYGLVKGVELTRGETDIQPRGQPVLVGYLACRTEVVQVVHLVLNTLQDPHLFSRVVDVVDGDGAIGANLPVRAQAALVPHLLLVEEEQGGQGQREKEEALVGRDLLGEVVVQAGRGCGQQAKG